MSLIPDPIIDAQLAVSEGTNCHVCSSEPANWAAIAAAELATAVISGSYSQSDGTPDGRLNTLPGQADLDITGAPTPTSATHYAISNGTDTLYAVATISNPQDLVNGGTVSVASLLHTIRDAT
jgi:hypothetical protein